MISAGKIDFLIMLIKVNLIREGEVVIVEKKITEFETVNHLLSTIRVKLESMPVRNSKIMKSPEILDTLENFLVDKQQDQLAIEKLVTFLASITLAPIKKEINLLKQHLNISI